MYPALIRLPFKNMYLTPIRVLHQGIYLAPIRLLHKGINLAPINFIITVLEYLAPITVFGYCFLCHGIRGLCTKNGINHFGLFNECNDLWPLQVPHRLRLKFIKI